MGDLHVGRTEIKADTDAFWTGFDVVLDQRWNPVEISLRQWAGLLPNLQSTAAAHQIDEGVVFTLMADAVGGVQHFSDGNVIPGREVQRLRDDGQIGDVGG